MENNNNHQKEPQDSVRKKKTNARNARNERP